ncbi:putative AAA-ATPase [Candidatus Arcanobacter lacustris]|uniref:Putative AAA-ATPase n=1 Tax=Candidatus Arcanibacter lacustris TaxID=1607817 RepID=A0A0F5MMX9_9RICK|nr:putative AAA-ATPase [Candidatus Arcanobacter lacustris]
MKLPIGISDFKELIEGKYQFADKSLFVKDIIDDGAKVILITRPRRFGKTLNLSMLSYFLDCNKDKQINLFDNLAISEIREFCGKHQNKYPVIFVSLKDIKQPNYQETYGDIVELFSQLYEKHRYLLEGESLSINEKNTFVTILNKTANLSEIKSALKQLTKYLSLYFSKTVVLLIDEYDTPIQEAYLRGYYQEMVDLMRSILGQALKDNSYLTKAVITGITRISQESLFSGLNNIEVYSLLREDYGQYFGFTEDEVIKLIKEANNPDIQVDAIREWYNGYQIGKHILYNPWSIINCLKNHGKLQPYWLNTSSNDLITKLLSNAKPNVKQQFEELLQGKIIEQALAENLILPEIETNTDSLWSLLLYAGYLKVLSHTLSGNRFVAKIAIPNKEVGFVYDKIVERWFSSAISLESYDNFVGALSKGDIDKFQMYLSNYIMQTGSYFDFNNNTHEQIFHIFVLGLVVGMREEYIINSNQEAGKGRFDVVLIPKDKNKDGILLEFKIARNDAELLDRANEALSQIKDKQYFQVFKQHQVKDVLAIGIAFCGKELELSYEKIEMKG